MAWSHKHIIGDDTRLEGRYRALMRDSLAHIILKIEYEEPIEIGDFVGAITAIGSQYDRFMRSAHPDMAPDAQIFVREVRAGSIEIDLVALVVSALSLMDNANTVTEFVKLYGGLLSPYFKVGGRAQEVGRSDLRDFTNAVAAIANDPKASASIEAAHFHDGNKQITAAFRFTTSEAKIAVRELAEHKREIEDISGADHVRKLMVFTQSSIRNAALGRRSGDRVVIQDISDRELPLIYASDLAEEKIKYEIREADDNIYRKAFIVDVNVEFRNEKPLAYRIVEVHQVLDLPSDD